MSRPSTVTAREQRNRRLTALNKGRLSPGSGSGSSPHSSPKIPPPSSPTSPPSSPRNASSRSSTPRSPSSRPPMVTPNSQGASSKTWDELREQAPPVSVMQPRLGNPAVSGLAGLAPRYRTIAPSDRSISSEMGRLLRAPSSPRASATDRSVVSEAFVRKETQISGDELEADVRSITSTRTDPERRREIRQLAMNRLSQSFHVELSPLEPRKSNYAPPHLMSPSASFDDDVSSLGGVEEQSSAIQRITLALHNHSARPSGLTREERSLWEAIQSYKHSKGEKQSPSKGEDKNSQVKIDELRHRLKSQEKEHESALRAIQRVLADVTAERDTAIAMCKEGNIDDGQEKRVLELALASKDSHIKHLEKELEIMKNRNKEASKENEQGQEAYCSLQNKLELVESEKEHLASELALDREQITEMTRRLEQFEATVRREDKDPNEVKQLRKELAEKSAALENAKLIITSLENASGSLATDLRSKLKAKEDELVSMRVEASERQRKLDSLTAEVRDLKRANNLVTRQSQKNDEERSRRLGLSSRLEKNMAELRAAAVVLESTNDPTTLDQVSLMLADSIAALKDGIDVIDDSADDSSMDDNASFSSKSSIPYDPRRLRKDLDEKAKTLHRMEEALRIQKEEASKLRAELGQRNHERDSELMSLRKEVQSLRDQCQANMQVLTRKERELAVLRDSLKVDDGVGYISDDGSDSEAESGGASGVPSNPPSLVNYGPTQAEALATLLAQASGNKNSRDVSQATISQAELQNLRVELFQARSDVERARKQLKTEKDSLANAKMIISSLERANKSMMEDLRSRLQDSNTAIASLLEKSLVSESVTAKLQSELDSLRKEREQERSKHEEELKKLRLRYDDPHPVAAICEEKKEDLSLTSLPESESSIPATETID